LGAAKIKAAAQQFGFEQPNLTVGQLNGGGSPVAASHTGDMLNPDGSENPAAVAQSSIGQFNVRMTPLQGALIAAAVANGGSQMRPYLVQQLLGPDRTTNYYTAAPTQLRQSISPQVATQMQDMMVSVVQNGTGRNAQISGYTVGGKTGTASSAATTPDHGWFIGYVMKNGQPISAVAVMLEAAGPTGSGEATRIAGQIMQAVIRAGGK
jgi:peptidoglycan glycosyltransferase